MFQLHWISKIASHSIYWTLAREHTYITNTLVCAHSLCNIRKDSWVYVCWSLSLCMSYLSSINTSHVRIRLQIEQNKRNQKPSAQTPKRKCANYFSTDNMMMWFCLKGNSHHGYKTKQKCRVRSMWIRWGRMKKQNWRSPTREEAAHMWKSPGKVKIYSWTMRRKDNRLYSKKYIYIVQTQRHTYDEIVSWSYFVLPSYLFYYPRRLLNTKMSCFFALWQQMCNLNVLCVWC